jgi:hypothetical protein
MVASDGSGGRGAGALTTRIALTPLPATTREAVATHESVHSGSKSAVDGTLARSQPHVLGNVRARHPANERHRRQHPAQSGGDVIDDLDHAVGLDDSRLRERHRKERPRQHQGDEQDRTNELA